MPNQPKTPVHTIRVPDDEWIPARDKAAEKGETMTDVIRRGLRRYVAGAAMLALILAGGVGASSQAAQASAPVTAPMSVSATFVATVRQVGAGTTIADRTDAELIASGKGLCADLDSGISRVTFWLKVSNAYQPGLFKGVSSYTQWVSIWAGFRQASVVTFCPQYL